MSGPTLRRRNVIETPQIVTCDRCDATSEMVEGKKFWEKPDGWLTIQTVIEIPRVPGDFVVETVHACPRCVTVGERAWADAILEPPDWLSHPDLFPRGQLPG